MLGFYLFCIFVVVFFLVFKPSHRQGQAKWWVEIKTNSPRCTYYFGPFDNDKEALTHTPGYIEDLEGEGAKRVSILIKRCQPSQLTICEAEFSERVAD